jgi:tetratricopeptide (TPR) repeat protein/predicted Ser/Thr protein kinase
MEDHKSKKGSPQGAGVAAKGDSSTNNELLRPADDTSASLAPFPPPAPVTPPNLVANPGETLSNPPGPPPPVVKPPATDVDPDATIAKTPVATGAEVPVAASIHIKRALQLGDVIGGRYEILSILGRGGMGSVYKALDREVGRTVALKLIRPELASDPAMLARFKQELLTSTQVTHKNVIRIYDIADADGLKFITMEFVEGDHLRGILPDNGKLSPEKAVEIIRQVCLALDAAHSAGIIHRDLKPPNIMQEAKTGRIVVMDFGIARSMQSEGMTQTGALLGTIEYMSPEQSMGKPLDQRSDIFSVGLIFYELLTGNRPYKAESAMASWLRRNQERAIPVVQLDTSIPKGLSDIVAKCLERDLDQRYQNVQEILSDLDAFQGSRPVMASVAGTVLAPVTKRAVPWKWVGVGTLVLVVATGAWTLRSKFGGSTVTPNSAGAHAPVSVLVADFTNHTGDTTFDGTLEPMFNAALEGASFINAYNRGTARRMAQKLPNPSDKLDEQPARLVALSQGVSAVITGEISRRGDKYNVSAIALDAATGNVIAKSEVTVANKEEVLPVIPRLAAPIRNAMGDTTPESAQLERSGGAFTAASLEVVHQYGIAMEQQDSGKVEEALRSFARVAELDPNFARAYSGMTSAALTLDQLQDAEKYIKLAMEHVDRMTDRERYRVRGSYYITTGNWQKCAEEYKELVSGYPGDNIARNNLAVCLGQLRKLPQAVEEARKDLATNPNSAAAANLSLLLSYSGDFRGGEDEASHVQQSYPAFEYGYLALAFAQLGQGQLTQAAETYQKLKTVSTLGASMSTSALADLALYEGRFADAARILEEAGETDLAAKKPDAAADKYLALAFTEQSMRRSRPALVAADKALANSRAVKTRFLAALVFAEVGELAKAQKIAAVLASELQSEPQACAQIIDGTSALKRGDARAAIKLLKQAIELQDTWIAHFQLARAYLEAGLFVESDSEFDRCIKRRGETLSLFLDQVPTFGYFPPVYYYQGRVREGLKSSGFADSYRTYLSMRGQPGEDPLLPEIRRRLGQ